MADQPGSQDDRTEAATPRRLQRARDEGQVPVSRELATLAGLAGVTLVLMAAGPALTRDLARHLGIFLSRADQASLAGGAGFCLVELSLLRAALPVLGA